MLAQCQCAGCVSPDYRLPVRVINLRIYRKFVSSISLHARTTGMSAQDVVYPGVRRSCFIDQARRSPASPLLAIFTVPRP